MLRDPFYQQIIDRLNHPLDPETFERCAADLLRPIYPGLVPIRGGGDAGMDGAVADATDEPFPLVTTTSDDVIGNLARNLTTYRDTGGRRLQAVLATSQPLTPRRRRNLFARARELGFTLLQVHDQDAFAGLLYRDLAWCRELLHLMGEPPALSSVPPTDRPLLSQDLEARDDDLAWLRNTPGDRLLIGQPGVGKTALLYQLARDGDGLFVIDRDRGRIAAALRTQQPQIVVVDDAHIEPDFLTLLRHLREETGGNFAIVASSWPGSHELVANRLNVSVNRTHKLALLTRDQILAIIQAFGIVGPNELLRELVNQAEGRPGMAVTLAHLCLQGSVREVIAGEALVRSYRSFFHRQGGADMLALVATFAIGGDAGMPVDVVVELLGITRLNLWTKISQLAPGGVLVDQGQQQLAVRPPALRDALVRDVYFNGIPPVSIELLITRAPSLPSVAHTLVAVRARGGAVPHDVLLHILAVAGSRRSWEMFAWLGRAEAQAAIQRFVDYPTAIARPALVIVPEEIIPRLLDAAVGDRRMLHATPEHPLRVLADWIGDAGPDPAEAMRCRIALFDAVRRWSTAGGDTTITLRALGAVFCPTFEVTVTDPGAGNTITITSGVVHPDVLDMLRQQWPDALAIIRNLAVVDWSAVRNLIDQWVHPPRVGEHIPAEIVARLHEMAEQMIRDLLPLMEDHPGMQQWVGQLAANLGVAFNVAAAPDYAVLFPARTDRDWREQEAQQLADVRVLARSWGVRVPIEVAERIATLERAADIAGHRWPRWTPVLSRELARESNSCAMWVQAAMQADLSSDILEPFLQTAAERQEPGWQDLLQTALERSNSRAAALDVVLTHLDPPADVLERALQCVGDVPQSVETLCLRGQVPISTVHRLLQHPDAHVVCAAAEGCKFQLSSRHNSSLKSGTASVYRDARS